MAKNNLTFDQKIKLRDWLTARHADIIERRLSREKTSEWAGLELGFPVNDGNLPTVAATLPSLDFGWQARGVPPAALAGLSEEVDRLSKRVDGIETAVANVSSALTDIQTKVAVLDSEYKSLSGHFASMRSELGKVKNDLEKALVELGFKKIDAETHKAVMTAAAKAYDNHKK